MKYLVKDGMGVLLAKIEKRFRGQPLFTCFEFSGKGGIKDALMEFIAQIEH